MTRHAADGARSMSYESAMSELLSYLEQVSLSITVVMDWGVKPPDSFGHRQTRFVVRDGEVGRGRPNLLDLLVGA